MIVIRLRCLLPTYLSQPSLICDFCPSDQRFAYNFLQIPPHDGHPCCSAIHFPLSGHVRDLHPLERAHGAQTKRLPMNISWKAFSPLRFLTDIIFFFHCPHCPSGNHIHNIKSKRNRKTGCKQNNRLAKRHTDVTAYASVHHII